MATRIIVAVVLAPFYFATLFFLPTIWLTVLTAGITGLAAYELLHATKAAKNLFFYCCTAIAAMVIPFGYWYGAGGITVRITALLLMCALFFSAIRSFGKEDTVQIEQIIICLFGGVLIPAMLSSLIVLKGMENGKYLVLLPVLCAFLTDTGAYFAGVFLGKHRGITLVSPNKSLEGYIGGILSGGIFLLVYGLILQNVAHMTVSFWILAVYGLIGSAVTELGDLSFSLIKRQFGVKDYGYLLPGHGGMLDRFDSMTFAAPMLLFLVQCMPPF